MNQLPNFTLTAQSAISRFLNSKEVTDFHSAIHYLQQLPATQECASNDLLQVAKEGGSRCSKTALLVALAKENFYPDIKLSLCTFTESYEDNTQIQHLLKKHQLPALPSTACFLKYHDAFYSPLGDMQIESSAIQSDIEITPMQIGSFTRRYRHHFIKHWLILEKLHRNWTVDKIREIRQQCRQILNNQAQ
ncbi:hypothetical protein [Tunicatimonas pelagia]|uniref:hypothetical protein n=1 Tax=Tunicatimonas pelagia TaxID=931531 RepID=UPI0026668DC3|nr:hypothetical protein [Tunicatimonas pelagia]WKN41979.1 hypothetical protein P0M28_23335 [Tunicatimonas pelagia]